VAPNQSGYQFLDVPMCSHCASFNYPNLGSNKTALLAVLQPNNVRYLNQITDGTSNTMMIGECAGWPDSYMAGTAGYYNNDGAGAWANPENAINLSGSDPTGAMSQSPTGGIPHGGTNCQTAGTASNPILTNSCTMNCTNTYNMFSGHPTGCNALFADGSVHFLASSIGWTTVAALGTVASGDFPNQEGY
jgi:prepilin-type processing-associated H-X9-DG protein